MNVFSKRQPSRWSLRRRLFGSTLLLTAILMFALTSGLFLCGRFSSTKKETVQTLSLQMEVFERDMTSYWEETTVQGIHLSQEVTGLLEEYLEGRGITFDQLTDSAPHIAELQKAVIGPLCQSLRQSDCSGAFVLFDTTVNSSIERAERSRSGLYVQKSRNTIVDDSLLLYRGLPDVGRDYGATPHWKWRLEFQTDLFPNYEELISYAPAPLDASYRITICLLFPEPLKKRS